MDSSKFSERVNMESQENLSFRKCLKTKKLAQRRGPHCKSYNGLQVLHSVVSECKIFCGFPKSGVDIHRLADIAKLSAHAAHTVEPNAALRHVLLEPIERQPQVVAHVLAATSREKFRRIDLRICAESDIASDNGKLDLLVVRQLDIGPAVSRRKKAIDATEEPIRENFRDFLRALSVTEAEGREHRGGSHQPILAQQAEHAQESLREAGPVVRVQEHDLRDDASEFRTACTLVLMAQGDEVLRVLGRSLADLRLSSISDCPAVRIEGLQVFLGADKLVTLREMLGGSGSKEGGDAGGEIVGHHGVNSSNFLLRLKGKVRKLSGTKFGGGFDVSA